MRKPVLFSGFSLYPNLFFKFSDTLVWATVQTLIRLLKRSSLIRVSLVAFPPASWGHYSLVKPLSLDFRMITINFKDF